MRINFFLPPYNFLGLEEKFTDFQRSKVLILPVPYEQTTTYGSGTKNGPFAIISASRNLELYDDELDKEPYQVGIHTMNEVESASSGPKDMLKRVARLTQELLADNRHKRLAILGGEHSITPGLVAAHKSIYPNLSVLQLDAHADLRQSYEGSKYSHACAIRRVLEICPAVQVGIRSLSHPEMLFACRQKLPIFFMNRIREDHSGSWIEEAISSLSENVYLTFDVDVFDPSIMPSTGTPEPGGMLWHECLKFLRRVAQSRNIVGFDVVELAPQSGNIAPDFLVAKIVYKIIGYAFMDNR